jgi:hypothetical protein
LEWTKIATDLKEPELKLSKYNRNKDYYFRIKAANEFGIAEPSMPAMLKKKEGNYSTMCWMKFSASEVCLQHTFGEHNMFLSY